MGWVSLKSNIFLHLHFVWMWRLASHCSLNSSNQPVKRINPKLFKVNVLATSQKQMQNLNSYWTWSGSRTSRQNAPTGPVDGSKKNFWDDCSLKHGTPGIGPKYCSLDFVELANQDFSLCCIMKDKIKIHQLSQSKYLFINS